MNKFLGARNGRFGVLPFQPSYCSPNARRTPRGHPELAEITNATTRREVFTFYILSKLFSPSVASANVFEEYLERSQRPDLTPEQALVKLLDARAVLAELKELAATAPNSQERFHARALLPGMAKSLRQVGEAAPVLVSQVTGSDKRVTLSKEYGGKGDANASANPVYVAIGQVITISGRTIKKEAQATPQYADQAINEINGLLDMLPKEEIKRAQEIREARRLSVTMKRTTAPFQAISN